MINCPICNLYTDFLTTKEDKFNIYYKYFICRNCGFIFEQDVVLDSLKLQKKVGNLYGNDYFENIDTGWQLRGDGFLHIVKKIAQIYNFIKFNRKISILDYGGGNGYIASKLAEDFNVFYYDKYEKPIYEGRYKILKKPNKVDIIYAVELVEHIVDIKEWDFLQESKADIFIFTTGLSDNIDKKDLSNWSYLAVNSGHMSLYSCKSLYILGKKYGFAYFFFPNISCHIFFKNKFLSKINFVSIEYFIYSLFRKIKNLFK